VNVETPSRFRGLGTTEIHGIRVLVATTFCSRLLGLALLSAESAPAGLLIPGCNSIHTFGMGFPIDIVFLDERRRELRRARVPPRRVARERRAAAVLELPTGS